MACYTIKRGAAYYSGGRWYETPQVYGTRAGMLTALRACIGRVNNSKMTSEDILTFAKIQLFDYDVPVYYIHDLDIIVNKVTITNDADYTSYVDVTQGKLYTYLTKKFTDDYGFYANRIDMTNWLKAKLADHYPAENQEEFDDFKRFIEGVKYVTISLGGLGWCASTGY